MAGKNSSGRTEKRIISEGVGFEAVIPKLLPILHELRKWCSHRSLSLAADANEQFM
jgi:hypothetical protein